MRRRLHPARRRRPGRATTSAMAPVTAGGACPPGPARRPPWRRPAALVAVTRQSSSAPSSAGVGTKPAPVAPGIATPSGAPLQRQLRRRLAAPRPGSTSTRAPITPVPRRDGAPPPSAPGRLRGATSARSGPATAVATPPPALRRRVSQAVERPGPPRAGGRTSEAAWPRVCAPGSPAPPTRASWQRSPSRAPARRSRGRGTNRLDPGADHARPRRTAPPAAPGRPRRAPHGGMASAGNGSRPRPPDVPALTTTSIPATSASPGIATAPVAGSTLTPGPLTAKVSPWPCEVEKASICEFLSSARRRGPAGGRPATGRAGAKGGGGDTPAVDRRGPEACSRSERRIGSWGDGAPSTPG